MKIQYLKRDEIDSAQWNSCIARSVNGIVYAYSWYLDVVSENWDALIGDDYQAVFPLTHKIKFGIKYLYQPYFTQQLGLFSIGHISSSLVNEFIDAIPNHFKFISISLNTFITADHPNAKVIPRVTYHLDLIEPYSAICSRYAVNTKRNISKATAYNISVSRSLTASNLLTLKRENMAVPLRQKHFNILNQLISLSIAKGVGEIYGAYTARNELCAGVLFLKTNGKVIYLLASSSDEGRSQRAMFSLIDYYINQHSELELVLDFEGSNIEPVARFYAGFGASPCEYNHIIINRLPWFLKLFK